MVTPNGLIWHAALQAVCTSGCRRRDDQAMNSLSSIIFLADGAQEVSCSSHRHHQTPYHSVLVSLTSLQPSAGLRMLRISHFRRSINSEDKTKHAEPKNGKSQSTRATKKPELVQVGTRYSKRGMLPHCSQLSQTDRGHVRSHGNHLFPLETGAKCSLSISKASNTLARLRGHCFLKGPSSDRQLQSQCQRFSA